MQASLKALVACVCPWYLPAIFYCLSDRLQYQSRLLLRIHIEIPCDMLL